MRRSVWPGLSENIEGQAAMSSQESYRDALRRVIDEVVAPGAAAVDASGEFPRAQVGRARRGRAAGADGAGRVRRRRRRAARGGGRGPRARVGLRVHRDDRDHALRGGRRAGRGRRQGHADRDRGRAAPDHAGVLRDRVASPLLGADVHRGALAGRGDRAARRAQELGHLGRASRQLRLVEPTAAGADGDGRGGRADDAVAGAGRRRRACRWPGRSTGSGCAATRRRR